MDDSLVTYRIDGSVETYNGWLPGDPLLMNANLLSVFS